MRITNSLLLNHSISALQQNLKGVYQAHQRASTGQRYTSFADNPHAQSELMRNAGSLRALDQFQRNISDGLSRATLEDSVLMQLGDVLTRARQIAIAESSSGATADTRQGAKSEIENLMGFIVGLGNTKHGDSYLFGGDISDKPPLSDTAPYYTTIDPPIGNHSTEISAGRVFQTTHNAGEVFLDTGALGALSGLIAGLDSGDPVAMTQALNNVITSHQNVQSLIGDIGARINQLDTVGSSLESLRITLSMHQSEIGEIGLEEAFTVLMSKQTAYEAAMAATARVAGMSLLDYMR